MVLVSKRSERRPVYVYGLTMLFSTINCFDLLLFVLFHTSEGIREGNKGS